MNLVYKLVESSLVSINAMSSHNDVPRGTEVKLSPVQEKFLDFCTVTNDAIQVINNKLRREVLTIIEASISDNEQRDAIKSLINEKINKEVDNNRKLVGIITNRISEALEIDFELIDNFDPDNAGNIVPVKDYYSLGVFIQPILGSDEDKKPITISSIK